MSVPKNWQFYAYIGTVVFGAGLTIGAIQFFQRDLEAAQKSVVEIQTHGTPIARQTAEAVKEIKEDIAKLEENGKVLIRIEVQTSEIVKRLDRMERKGLARYLPGSLNEE